MEINKNIVIEIVNSLNTTTLADKGEGWINLVNIGKALKHAGIDYAKEHKIKLRTFLEIGDFGLEFCETHPGDATVVYARCVNQKNGAEKRSRVRQHRANGIINLEDWAYLGDINDMLEKLADMAIPEDWNFRNDIPRYPSKPILWSYIRQTFIRLQHQKQVYYSIARDYAAFNTGLVDQRYMPIIALFKKNSPGMKSEWVFNCFVFPGEGKGKMISKDFTDEILPATYTDSPIDLLYDTNIGEPCLDYHHIIISRISRIPAKLIEELRPAVFEVRDTSSMSPRERSSYFCELTEAIDKSPTSYRRFISRLDSAVSLAIKRTRWSPRTAVPMYHSRKNKMCLLIPLCLVDDRIEDVALVVSKSQANKYEGATILPLDWAYADARVVSQPSSSWLGTSYINGTETF